MIARVDVLFFRGGLSTPHGPCITLMRRQSRRARLTRARLRPPHACAFSVEVAYTSGICIYIYINLYVSSNIYIAIHMHIHIYI